MSPIQTNCFLTIKLDLILKNLQSFSIPHKFLKSDRIRLFRIFHNLLKPRRCWDILSHAPLEPGTKKITKKIPTKKFQKRKIFEKSHQKSCCVSISNHQLRYNCAVARYLVPFMMAAL